MPKEKRSFFERLTGSITLNDEPTTAEVKNEAWPEDEEDAELALDVYQTPSEIIIQTMVAGVRPEDLEINITREMVTIRGRRERISRSNNEDYFQQELFWGSFSRTVLLPAEVEAEDAEAIEKNGLLTITLPKIDKKKTKQLRVRSS